MPLESSLAWKECLFRRLGDQGMKFAAVIFICITVGALPAAAGPNQGGGMAQGGNRLATASPGIASGPQMFIDDTNTAIILAPVETATDELPGGTIVPRTEFDRSRLNTTQEQRGIGIGEQGTGTALGPQSSEPTIGPQSNEPQIGEQGTVILPGLSDQGPIFPEPNTVAIAPQFNARLQPGYNPTPQGDVTDGSGAVLVPESTGRRHVSRASVGRLQAEHAARNAAGSPTAPGATTPSPAPAAGRR